jgi:hypothetical protein
MIPEREIGRLKRHAVDAKKGIGIAAPIGGTPE